MGTFCMQMCPQHQSTSPPRTASVDVVRGAIMVIMALDHVRDFVTNLRFQPEDLARGSAALFATRWITHFCAPGFFLLAGIGTGLAMQRGKTAAEMSRFLVTRGLWLVFLELTVMTVAWQFGFQLMPAIAVILWALGWSMVAMAAIVHAPRVVVAVVSLALIAGHNLFDKVQPSALGSFGWLWTFLHAQGFMIPGKLFIAYPLVPWVAVMAIGWVLASTYSWEPARRQQLFLRVGAAAVVAFIVLRYLNGYGNTFTWTEQRTSALTVASFLNVQKYPPSLDFLLMTLGPMLMVLALTERARGRIADWLTVYGRVPLFYYVLHFTLAHIVGVCLRLIQGGELAAIPILRDPAAIPAWYGVSLPGVYLAWALVVALMYWPCRWFADLKRRRSDWWLGYL
jgi:uncharacterized membrane protein